MTEIQLAIHDTLETIHVARRAAALAVRDDDRAGRIIFDYAEDECQEGKALLANGARYAALPHLQASLRLYRTLANHNQH